MATDESVANTILHLSPNDNLSTSYTAVQLTPSAASPSPVGGPGMHFPDTSTVIHQNRTTQECIEIPITIRENKAMDIIYDDIAETPDTPNPSDISIDEAKIHLFNAYTVCLDGNGPILTLKQVQMRTASYLSQYEGWKIKYPPKLLFLLVICFGLALYGLISMIISKLDHQFPLIVCVFMSSKNTFHSLVH